MSDLLGSLMYLEWVDPRKVCPPVWGGRLETDSQKAESQLLGASMLVVGGNIQPVYLSRRFGSPEQDPAGGYQFDLVTGLRRLRACIANRQLLFAIVRTWESRQEQFLYAVHENRSSGDSLSSYEFGRMCHLAIQEGIFHSWVDLADALGMIGAEVRQEMFLSRLPKKILSAFPDPSELRVQWLVHLLGAYQLDEIGLCRRVDQIKANGEKLSARQIYQRLTDLRLVP